MHKWAEELLTGDKLGGGPHTQSAAVGPIRQQTLAHALVTVIKGFIGLLNVRVNSPAFSDNSLHFAARLLVGVNLVACIKPEACLPSVPYK